MIAVGTLAVSSKANAPAGRSGSTYTKDDRETGSGRSSHAAVVVTSDTASALPFKPVTVAWKARADRRKSNFIVLFRRDFF